MAALTTGNLFRVRSVCYTPSQISVNVTHWRVVTHAGTGATTQNAADDFDGFVSGPYKALLADDARYRGVSVQIFSPLPITRPSIAVLNDGPGLVVGEIMPGQVCGIISAHTDFSGRKQRARVYVPFPSEADSEVPGAPTNAYLINLQALGTALYGEHTVGIGGNTSTVQPVVLHRVGGNVDVITGFVQKKQWATQRRRSAFGRQNPLPF